MNALPIDRQIYWAHREMMTAREWFRRYVAHAKRVGRSSVWRDYYVRQALRQRRAMADKARTLHGLLYGEVAR